VAVTVEILPAAQRQLDAADERWVDEHGLFADNPLFEQISHARGDAAGPVSHHPPTQTSVDLRDRLRVRLAMAVPQQLLQQLLALDESVRREIAHTLLESVDETVDDAMSADERARLDAALERSLAQADAGRTVPADEVFRALRAKRSARVAR
jgi:predicted transcriptional regulator